MIDSYMIRRNCEKPRLNFKSEFELEDINYKNDITQQDRWHLYMVTMSKKSFGPMNRADKDGLVEYVADVKIIR